MNIGDKIKNLLKEKGLKQIDLIRYITGEGEVPAAEKTRWSRYLNNQFEIPLKDLQRVAKFFNVDVDYLLGNEVPITYYIPLIGSASCGVPTNHFYSDMGEYEMIPVPASLYREGRYYVRAEGDSMLPKIKPGDEVMCDKEAYVENGNIVHYTLNDEESGIKKVVLDENGKPVMFVPLNDKYSPIIVKPDDKVRMAKCIKITTDL